MPYPYVITACPDGEGAWFQETMEKYPEIAKACKEAYKGKFTPEFVKLITEHVRNCEQPLTLVDIGGRIDDYNREICKSATHIVIIAGNDPETGKSWNARMEPWRKFAKELNLTVVAEIFSDYHGETDALGDFHRNNILRGSIHYLERGENVVARPMVQALARHILTIAGYPLIGAPLEESSTYTIIRDESGVLRVDFGAPGDNTQIVKDADARLDTMRRTGELSGGVYSRLMDPRPYRSPWF